MGYTLLLLGSFSKISLLKTLIDVYKAAFFFLYTTKEKGEQTIGDYSRAYTNWPQNINIWSNHTDTHSKNREKKQL